MLHIVTVHEPPSAYLDTDGQSAGFSVDVVKEIQRRLMDSTPITIVPEKRLFSMAEFNEHTVIIGISRTPAREHRFRWVTKLLDKPWILYSYGDRNADITTLDQAKKVRVGVVNGDVREEYAREQGFEHIDASNSHYSNMKKLIEGRIDLAFGEPQGLAYEASVSNIDPSEFKARVVPYVSEVYLAMPKNADRFLFRIWEKAAQDMKQDGTFFAIAAKWSILLERKYGIASVPSNDSLAFTQ